MVRERLKVENRGVGKQDRGGLDMVRERLKVENITERCRKARQGWFGHGQGETEGREHHREV